MSELCQDVQPTPEPDERLLELVGAALKRFGPLRMRCANAAGECVLSFPQPPKEP